MFRIPRGSPPAVPFAAWLLALLVSLACWMGGLTASATASASGATSIATATGAQPIELRRGSVVATLDGTVRREAVELPYHWDRLHGGRPGLASFDLPFELAAVPGGPWGIFIPRTGNAVEVQLNDALLQSYGDLSRGNGADYAKAPIYLPVPVGLLRAGENHLHIRLRADSARRAGLSTVFIGPAASVRTGLFEPAYAWRFTGSVVLAAFSLLVGAIALALWLTQVDADAVGAARRDGIYLWAAVAEFCWAIRVADGVIAEPPLPWIAWGVLMAACYAGWAASAMMFCCHLAGWVHSARTRWLRWPLLAVVLGTLAASALALGRGEPAWLTGWLAIEIAVIGLFVGAFVASTVRRPDIEKVLVAVTAFATLAFGVRDWLVIRLSGSYGETTWVRYSSVFFGIALLLIVLRRFRSASLEARGAVRTLADRVAQRERELASTYAELERSARDQARTHERERILRDMHDGVGSHISAAIRGLQSGQGDSEEVLRTLQDSMDQLKLSIDSIHLPRGDVGALLAAFRYRLEPRLASAGIALDWAVDEVAPLPHLDAHGMRQLQFLLFEAISNVLRHARARVLRLEARMDGAMLLLQVIDDGCGFDGTPPRGLTERAGAVGARLTLESRPGRTVVQLVFD